MRYVSDYTESVWWKWWTWEDKGRWVSKEESREKFELYAHSLGAALISANPTGE